MTGRNGLGRSLDGGATWSGLNDTLPNLPVRRLPALPRGAAAHAGGRRTLGVPLRDASPAMFVDRDGAPRVFDADRSGLLDAMATGLGRVPRDGPPAWLRRWNLRPAPVKVYLDRAPRGESAAPRIRKLKDFCLP